MYIYEKHLLLAIAVLPTPILMPDLSGRYFVSNDMNSTQEVRKGDPLASLLFACAFHTALTKTAQQTRGLACLIVYHDDTTITIHIVHLNGMIMAAAGSQRGA